MQLPPTTPHITRTKKTLEFDRAPFGITGLETAIGLAFELVHQGVIDLERLVALCSTNPARIFGLENRGSFEERRARRHHHSRCELPVGV